MWTRWTGLIAVMLITGCTTNGDDVVADTSTTPPATSTAAPTPAPTTTELVTTTSLLQTTTVPASTSTTGTTTAVNEPPLLEIADPAFGATLTSRVYEFRGVTDPGCTVDVGGRYFANVDSDGGWTLPLTLNPGRNATTLVATQPATGQRTDELISVYYAEPPGLEGTTLRTVWEEPGWLQQYYVRDEPTGYYGGSRLPLAWSGDNVSLRLGLSTQDSSVPERTYGSDFDGLIMLLEAAGRDQYLVLDEQPVMIAADTGILTAMCPADDIPHVVTVGFTSQGLAPVQAWRVDRETRRLAEVPVDVLPCPDLSIWPVGDDGVGAMVTHYPCGPDTVCDHRFIGLSAGGAEPMSFWSLGGGVLPSEADFGRHAVSRVVMRAGDWSEPIPSRFWLKEWIGYDWSGLPIWRVLDATPVAEHPVTSTCYLVEGRGPAFAEIESWEDPPLRAWTVDADYTHFEEISTEPCRC